jgi:DNA mismatch endonuclease (patch repair protein)
MSTAPPPSSYVAQRTMEANRRRDTVPELRLRSLLHRAGHRFRCDYPVRADGRLVRVDIAFPCHQLAIFSDGCFWHSCPEHGQVPAANRDYWEPKLARNAERDREVDAALAADGWTVLRFWEHTPPEKAAVAVARRLSRARRPRVPSAAPRGPR